jgi:tetratricopeptide (TPR) repeat protein
LLVYYLAGMLEVRAGRAAAAQARLGSLKRGHNPRLLVERWLAQSLEGEIALAAGRIEEAAAAYTRGEPSGRRMWTYLVEPASTILANNSLSRDGSARVLKAGGDLAGAIDAYRRLLGPATQHDFAALLEPRHILELARLLEQTGDRAGARVEYQRFLNLWKNADAGLPELAEASRAVQRLR